MTGWPVNDGDGPGVVEVTGAACIALDYGRDRKGCQL